MFVPFFCGYYLIISEAKILL